jgi:hypothetical protein
VDANLKDKNLFKKLFLKGTAFFIPIENQNALLVHFNPKSALI